MSWKALSTVLLCSLLSLFGLSGGDEDVASSFDHQEVMIRMRDGVRLHTEIYAPKGARPPLPFLMVRTPYGTRGFRDALNNGSYQELVKDGYIFVTQDIRGRYESEGQFVMLRPPRERHDSRAIDEGTDTYDSIDWLLQHVARNNGRVGITGVSYPGWLTVMATLDPHPALKAVSEQASPADMYLGDDFHHNGAFRLSYGFEYAAMMETSKTNFRFQFDCRDTYEWYLRLGPLAEVNRQYLHGKLPTWNAFVEHPNYDAYWRRLAVPTYLDRVTVPDLHVAGWWDQEDFYGPLEIYRNLEARDTEHRNYLAVGPWNHGGWRGKDGRKLGPLDFGSDTAREFRERIEAPWFAHWLKDKGGSIPEARTFRTGTNQWQSYDAWPPLRGKRERNLYFQAGGELSFTAPSSERDDAFDSYVSDPARPVPYRKRPISPTYPGGGWPVWLLEDQRFVDLRPDVLSWRTEPLTEDLNVAGDLAAHLFASTSGTDSDWIVKLIDVYPEEFARQPEMGGYQLMVANEVFRGRFHKSFEHPEALVPDQVTPYVIGLHAVDHCFEKGHSIMVQVQSTWFPLIDRNPQKFVPNIFAAREQDFQKATQRIFHSSRFPSHLTLPTL
ncbi:MAG TPA: CocE/NonD family hydrolase [Bryobacteraceae bacterium]|nr:CocE/NonD family hydrolase [Bryobacteraceae bacterium]